MSQNVDLQVDPATIAASLTAEATALEGRLRQLREAVHVVNARITSIAESLQTLRGTATTHRQVSVAPDPRRTPSLSVDMHEPLRPVPAPPEAPIRCRPGR